MSATATQLQQTLRSKLISVYESIDHIEKKGRNELQKYSYVRATDIARAIREALQKQHVYAEVNFTTERTYLIERGKDDRGNQKPPMQAVDVRASVIFHDAYTNETLTASGLGSGADMGDKAVYKAQTGALKYALRSAFLVPDESDPESDESTDRETQPNRAARPVAAPKLSGPPRAEIPQSVAPQPAAPSEAAASQTTSAASPSPETYRERAKLFVNNLSVAGLKPSRGQPVAAKFKKYLLTTTSVKNIEDISLKQWQAIFGAIDKTDIKELVKIIEEKSK